MLPELAPNHVGLFIKLAREGGYVGTTFHRAIRYGIVQAGDPLSKDPAKFAQYGTGGLNQLRGEINAEPMTAGAVAGVLIPNAPNSAGAQFFICASDQAGLQGQYTVFGRVVEGLEVVQEISALPANAEQRLTTRVEIKSVTIRDTPPPVIDPLVAATAAELGTYRAVIDTTKGAIELAFLADKAPETTRNFLRLAGRRRVRRRRRPSRRARIRPPDRSVRLPECATDRGPAETGAQSPARVFRHAEPAGYRLDGAR